MKDDTSTPTPDGRSPNALDAADELAELRKAQAALRENEEKYRTLFEEMDEGFALCQIVRDDTGRPVDFRYIDLNPAVLHHAGVAPERLRGRLATEVFPDRDPWYLETFAHVVDSGQSVLEEHYFDHVGRWLRMNVFPRGGDRFAVLYSDITEAKRAEAALRQSEERQGFLLRFTDAIRSEPNEEAVIKRAVQMLADQLGVDRAYATRHYPARDLTEVVHEVRRLGLEPLPATLRFSDFPEAGRQTFHRTLIFEDTANDQSLTDADKLALASMRVGALLSRPLRRDGSPIFALGVVSVLPRRWTPGEIAIVEDAAERTWEAVERARAEAALRESEEKYAGLFAASPAPFLILRPDAPHFTIADVNDAYLAATMRTREDLVGRAMFDAFPDNPDDPAANGESNLRAALEGAVASRRFQVMDVQKYDIVRPDGTFEERWWKPANAPVLDADGNVVAIIHHVADVTAEHRAVDALQASERHAQTLLAELQHRVRNTLAVVRSIARRTAENSDRADDMLAHFQGRLDAFSRVQAAMTRNPEGKVDIASLIEDELIAHAARDGEQLSINGPPVPLDSKAAERLSLAIHELTTNAVKHGALTNGTGRIAIEWTAGPGEGGGDELHLSWRESGVGIETLKPEREGFGMELLARSLPYDLSAETRVELTPTGLHFELRLPLNGHS